jgi:hypothetical protein
LRAPHAGFVYQVLRSTRPRYDAATTAEAKTLIRKKH